MQGQLRGEPLTFNLQTECACCGQALGIVIDSDLNYAVTQPGARPLVFVPMVDFSTLEDPSIIDAF